MKIPIIMCNWKRTDNIPRTLAMLEGQTNHEFKLYIWNNNAEDKEKLDEIVKMYKLSYKIDVQHSNKNVGGIGRFYFAKEVANTGYDGPCIFIDDDVQFGEDMVETFISEFRPDTIHSFYAHKIKDSYWDKEGIDTPGEDVDYCGTGGMILPIRVFTENELFEELPERYKFIEDLWLSYYFKYKCKGSLKRSNNNFILESDQHDQGRQEELRSRKDELLEFCKDKFVRKETRLSKKFNGMFEETYVINMNTRPDRMMRSSSRLKDLSINFKRFEAVKGDDQANHPNLMPGEVGCYLSHFNIISEAKARGLKSILILEDDVVFTDNVLEKFFEGYKHIPEDWEMIYLGCNHKKPYTRINDRVVKCNYAYTTSAYIIKDTVYDKLLEATRFVNRQIDVQYAELQAAGQINAYAFHPWLMYQEDGWSDIQQRNVDYGMMRR